MYPKKASARQPTRWRGLDILIERCQKHSSSISPLNTENVGIVVCSSLEFTLSLTSLISQPIFCDTKMATLSGPANIFSIVGLADVVYRASKDLHDTFRRMQGSQQACTTLSQSLKNISAIAAEITVLPSDTNHQSILSTIHDILTDCRQELEGLQAIGNSVKHASIDTWVTKLRKSSTWAFSEREISQALRRLEQQKLSLAVALAGLIA